MISREELRQYAQNIYDGKRGYSLEKAFNLFPRYGIIVAYEYEVICKNSLTNIMNNLLIISTVEVVNVIKWINEVLNDTLAELDNKLTTDYGKFLTTEFFGDYNKISLQLQYSYERTIDLIEYVNQHSVKDSEANKELKDLLYKLMVATKEFNKFANKKGGI